MFFSQVFVEQYKNIFGIPYFLYSLDNIHTTASSTTIPSIIKTIISSTCANNIGEDYRNSLSKSIATNINSDKYDMVLISLVELAFNTRSIKSIITNNVFGFMIVEKGECNKDPYTENYCVNLICSNKQGIGAVLMSLYLYIIINDDAIVNKTGLLELANSYYNTGGLCAYTKFGFEYNNSLSDDTCFRHSPPNLPMSVDINNIYGATKEEQNNKLLGLFSGQVSLPKPNICKIKDPDRQLLLALALNIQMAQDKNKPFDEANDPYLFDYSYGNYISKFESANGVEIDYKKLREEIDNNYRDVNTFINSLLNNTISPEQIITLKTMVYSEPQAIQSMPAPTPEPRVTRSKTPRGGRRTKRYNRHVKRRLTKRRNKHVKTK